MNLIREIQEQHDIVRAANLKIAGLRKLCSHPIEVVEATSHRTNDEWDSHAHYTYFYNCGICGHTWTTDGN